MKTNIILFPMFVVLGLIVYVVITLIPMYIYNSNTTGKIINNVEEIEMCNIVINKKYEIILYGRNEELKTMYSSKYYDAINNFTNSKHYEELLNDFYKVNIDKVYKKMGNVYIVKYKVSNLDNFDKEFTIIINMNWDKSRAVIVYDDMFN